MLKTKNGRAQRGRSGCHGPFWGAYATVTSLQRYTS